MCARITEIVWGCSVLIICETALASTHFIASSPGYTLLVMDSIIRLAFSGPSALDRIALMYSFPWNVTSPLALALSNSSMTIDSSSRVIFAVAFIDCPNRRISFGLRLFMTIAAASSPMALRRMAAFCSPLRCVAIATRTSRVGLQPLLDDHCRGIRIAPGHIDDLRAGLSRQRRFDLTHRSRKRRRGP